MKSAIIPAVVVAALLNTAARAAPIAPTNIASAPVETVQFRGGNWGDHPLMYPGNWYWHQRQWDAFEGRRGDARPMSCTRFRSYDRASQTYVTRNGRRVHCP